MLKLKRIRVSIGRGKRFVGVAIEHVLGMVIHLGRRSIHWRRRIHRRPNRHVGDGRRCCCWGTPLRLGKLTPSPQALSQDALTMKTWKAVGESDRLRAEKKESRGKLQEMRSETRWGCRVQARCRCKADVNTCFELRSQRISQTSFRRCRAGSSEGEQPSPSH